MKHLLVMLIGIIFLTVLVSSCNDGKEENPDFQGCTTYRWSLMSSDLKQTLIGHGFDTTKCYKIEP